MWHYGKANRDLITRAIINFDWNLHLNKIMNPNIQVEFLNNTILNIFNNFIPSSTFTSKMNEPKWITKKVKNLLRKQKKLYKNYKCHGFKVTYL